MKEATNPLNLIITFYILLNYIFYNGIKFLYV